MAPTGFNIIPSHTIDAGKWDNCIRSSEANRIYAKYVYLQHLADNWSGLIIDDYAAVMPIVWRQKWGVRYTYDAPFIQQLGLFGKYTTADLKQAIDITTRHIKYGDLYFNHTNNAVQQLFPAVKISTNLVVPLLAEYKAIKSSYSNHTQNKLRKAANGMLTYQVSGDIELAANTYRQLYGQRLSAIKEENYESITGLAKQLFNQQQSFVRQVLDKENNLLAVALFLKDESRIYNILPSTTAMGRKLSAMHFLIDNVIKEFAGTPLILDFEGSDIPGISTFYQSFGAVNEPYYHLHYNYLPAPVKWLKR